MNNQTIEKIITSNNMPCPELTFENPLIDKNVTAALSKSFVQILNMAQQNSKVNNNLRLSILENIRKTCQIEPDNHMNVDENVTTLLSEVYEQKLRNSNEVSADATSKILDEFLVRNMKDLNINSNHDASLKPEIMQALINLNKNGISLESICKDIIHWNSENDKNFLILKKLWTSGNFMVDDISIKLKPELEKILLNICHIILNDPGLDIKDLFTSNADLNTIVTRCANSASCFEMSINILNSVFILTNFALRMQTFVQTFVDNVKQNCPLIAFTVLYPSHLNTAALLLDIPIQEFPEPEKEYYVKATMKYLCELQSKSDNDLILILSHFPQWFDIYFTNKNSK